MWAIGKTTIFMRVFDYCHRIKHQLCVRRRRRRHRSSSVRLDSIALSASSGQAPRHRLVVLHGLFGSNTNWRQLAVQWNKSVPDVELHLLTARNHGHSAQAEEMSYDAMCADLSAYLQRIAVRAEHHRARPLDGRQDGDAVRAREPAARQSTRHCRYCANCLSGFRSARRLCARHARPAAGEHAVAQRRRSPSRRHDARSDDARVSHDQFGAHRRRPLSLAAQHRRVGARLGARGAALLAVRRCGLYEPYAGPTLVLRGGKSNYVTAGDV
jgi:hypothetical protein